MVARLKLVALRLQHDAHHLVPCEAVSVPIGRCFPGCPKVGQVGPAERGVPRLDQDGSRRALRQGGNGRVDDAQLSVRDETGREAGAVYGGPLGGEGQLPEERGSVEVDVLVAGVHPAAPDHAGEEVGELLIARLPLGGPREVAGILRPMEAEPDFFVDVDVKRCPIDFCYYNPLFRAPHGGRSRDGGRGGGPAERQLLCPNSKRRPTLPRGRLDAIGEGGAHGNGLAVVVDLEGVVRLASILRICH
mmetsp:Transcript_67764/g.141651  ORF Transcript_67764/g.141651 Transcript_67764/m.141651 type:complete len:247 (-) Transcript_67764:634-1374(-)